MAGYYYHDPSGLGVWYVEDGQTPADALIQIQGDQPALLSPILVYSVANTPAAHVVNGGNKAPENVTPPPKPTSYSTQGANLVPALPPLSPYQHSHTLKPRDIANPGDPTDPFSFCDPGYWYQVIDGVPTCVPVNIDIPPGGGGEGGTGTVTQGAVYVTVNNAVDLASGVGQAIGDTINQDVQSAIDQTNSAIKDTTNTIQAALSDVTTGIGSLVDGIIQNIYKGLQWLGNLIVNNIGSILGFIRDNIGTLVTDVKSALDTITGVIQNDIVPVINQVNGVIQNTIAPIFNTISQTYQQTVALVDAIKSDVSNGLKGILQLPTDLANGLSALSNDLANAVQQLGFRAKDGSTTTLDYIMDLTVGQRLSSLGSSILQSGPNRPGKTTIDTSNPLTEPDFSEAIGKNFDALWREVSEFVKNSISSYRGLGDLLKSVPLIIPFLAEAEWEWPAAIIGFVLALIEAYKPALKFLEEDLAAKSGLAKLDPQTALEAWRRNLIDTKSLNEELAANGWDQSRRDVQMNLQGFLIDVQSMLDLYFRGIVVEDDLRANLLEHGITRTQQDALVQGSYRLFDVQSASIAFLRKLIQEEQLDAILHANRYTDAEITTYKATLIAPGGLNSNVFRNRFAGLLAGPLVSNPNGTTPPTDLFERAQALGLSTEEAEAAWYGAFTVPQIREWIDMYRRGFIDRRQLDAAFDFYKVLPEWRGNLIGASQSLIPFRTIPAMLKAGIIDEPYARQVLTAHGFDLVAINALIKYAGTKANTAKATKAQNLHTLSLATVHEFWVQGAITDAQYKDSLIAHGYDADTADLEIKVQSMIEHTKERRQTANYIIDEATIGLITDDQAQQQLVNNGFTLPEIARYIKQLRSVRRANAKMPSEAELKAFLKAGIIDLAGYTAALLSIGYPQTWAQAFTELNKGLGPQPAISTP